MHRNGYNIPLTPSRDISRRLSRRCKWRCHRCHFRCGSKSSHRTTHHVCQLVVAALLLQCHIPSTASFQRQSFNVTFKLTEVGCPKVRVFQLGSSSLFLNATSQVPGSAPFIEDNRMGRQVVLLFDNGNGNRQSTKTWGGCSSTSQECLDDQQKDKASY